MHQPVSNRAINYANSDTAIFREKLFHALHERPKFALRLGQVVRVHERSWILKPQSQKLLLNGDIEVSDLKDSDFVPHLRQKGVDMRIGLDIASITLKKQGADTGVAAGDL